MMLKLILAIFVVLFVAAFWWQIRGLPEGSKPSYSDAFWVALFISALGGGFLSMFVMPFVQTGHSPSGSVTEQIEYRR